MEAVRRVCEEYVEGWYAGDAGRIERSVHPEFSKRYIRRFASGAEFLEEIGASKFIEWTACGQSEGTPEDGRTVEVTILDCFARAAMARVSYSPWGVEYLQLGKLGASWKIVNALSQAQDSAPAAPPSVANSNLNEKPTGSEADKDSIAEAVRDYGEGWCTGDVSRMARVTHPQWSKKGFRLGRPGSFFLESWGADKMTAWVAATEHQATTVVQPMEITVLDRYGDIAATRLAWELSADGFPRDVDYLVVAKIKHQWRAINIIWDSDRAQGDPDLTLGSGETWQW